MDCSYYRNDLFDTMMNEVFSNSEKDDYNTQVYSHLQQTLQVQTNNLKCHQQRVEDFLNCSAVTGDNSIMAGLDEIYSSSSAENMTYLQLMQQTEAPFYTPLDSAIAPTSALSETFDFTSSLQPTSVAGLDIGEYSSSPSVLLLESHQHQQLLCHPLSSFPNVAATDDFTTTNNHLPCDYFFNDDNNMFVGLSCSVATFDSNSCFNEMNPSSTYFPPILSYPSPKFHERGVSLSGTEHTCRNNSAPMLSASYSFSSFSSASSNEDDSAAEEELLPKKSASISFLPEKRRQQKTSTTTRNKVAKPRKFSLNNKRNNNSMSSDSISYYLSKQQPSDNEDDDDEEFEGTKMTGSSSSGMICKKGRNVDKACNHCKRSHLRCDNVRPCRRCVATGKVGCQDVKHKPRGRPRLQKRL